MTCAFTVATLMKSSSAISALDAPRPIASATSRSRSVRRSSRVPGVRAPGGEAGVRDVADELRVTAGESIASPAATSPHGLQDVGRRRVLEQEAARARTQCAQDVVVGVERREDDDLRRAVALAERLVAASPSILRIRMSMSTTSGR